MTDRSVERDRLAVAVADRNAAQAELRAIVEERDSVVEEALDAERRVEMLRRLLSADRSALSEHGVALARETAARNVTQQRAADAALGTELAEIAAERQALADEIADLTDDVAAARRRAEETAVAEGLPAPGDETDPGTALALMDAHIDHLRQLRRQATT